MDEITDLKELQATSEAAPDYLAMAAGQLLDPLEEVKPPEIAIKHWQEFEHYIVGTRGNISTIIGKAKSRKSFFVALLAAAAASGRKIGPYEGSLPENKNHVVFIDTEQSKFHVSLAQKRILRLFQARTSKNLSMYHLRKFKPDERLEMIQAVLYSRDDIGLLIIDGVRDIVFSINDEIEATKVTSDLMKWSEERDCHIICVLHQNKGDNHARGHVGSELVNKSETVLSVAKAEEDDAISIVEAAQVRNIEPPRFAFEIMDGLPVEAENFAIRTAKENNRTSITDIMTDTEMMNLFTECFSKQDEMSYTDLRGVAKLVFNKTYGRNLGDNRIKDLVTYGKHSGMLEQSAERRPYRLGSMPTNVEKIAPSNGEEMQVRKAPF